MRDRRGVFYKPKDDALVMISVDDFNMSCKEKDMAVLWDSSTLA